MIGLELIPKGVTNSRLRSDVRGDCTLLLCGTRQLLFSSKDIIALHDLTLSANEVELSVMHLTSCVYKK